VWAAVDCQPPALTTPPCAASNPGCKGTEEAGGGSRSDFDGTGNHRIDFFYTVNVPAEALFLDEIEKAASVNKNFKAHISYSSQDGRLSVPKIVEASGPVSGKDIYMCGPFGMVMAFREAFIEQGAKADNIHYEEFNFR